MSVVVSLVGLVVIAIVMGAMVIVAMLLANPQTRGVGLTFLATGGLLFLLGVGFLTATQVRYEKHSYETQYAEMTEAADRAAWDVDSEPGSDQSWEDHSHEASISGHGHSHGHEGHDHEAGTAEAAHAGGGHTHSEGNSDEFGRELSTAEALYADAEGGSPTWFMGSVWLLVFGTVVVGLLLVRSESSMGVGLLGLAGGAVVLMLVLGGWVYMNDSASIDTPRKIAANETASGEVDSAWDYATAPRIMLDATETSEGEADSGDEEGGTDEESGEEDAETDSDSAESKKPSRPEWTGETYTVINHDRQSQTTRRVVVSQPYSTVEECDEDLIGAIDRAVEQHLADLTGSDSYVSKAHACISRAFIMQNCVIDRFAEQKQSETGFPYWRQWARLEFTPATDGQLLASYRSAKRANRVTQVAMGGAGVLGTLGLILGMLRIDTATKGYYSKRLFIGVPVAIIAALGLLAFLA